MTATCGGSGGRDFCVVTETYPPDINGVASTLGCLVDGLRQRGHRVVVVRPRARHSGDGPGLEAEIVTRGVPFPGYPEVRIGLAASCLLEAAWARRRPDAVYVATEGPLGWSALRAARRLRLPIFGGFHTNFHVYARHYGIGWLAPLIHRGLRRFHDRTTGTLV